MTNIQFLTDAEGKRHSAVIPIALFEQLMSETELDIAFEPVPYKAGKNDDEVIPHGVVSVQRDKDVPLHVAWRLYRGLSQGDVAAALGITQAGVSRIESRTRPRNTTLNKLAAVYECRITQLHD